MRKLKLTKSLTWFILRERREHPLLGCRGLSKLLKEKYNLSVSKSLINKAILSRGIRGRRGIKPQEKILITRTIDKCGLFLLKAMELDMCFDKVLSESIQLAFHRASTEKLLELFDFFLYAPFFKVETFKIKNIGSLKNVKKQQAIGLWKLLGLRKRPSLKSLRDFHNKFHMHHLHSLIIDSISKNLKQVRCFKLNFTNKSSIYIDSSLRSLWSNPQDIPLSFSRPLIRVKEYLDKIVNGHALVVMGSPYSGKPYALFNEFLDGASGKIEDVQLIGLGSQVMDTVVVNSTIKFILGFFPQDAINQNKSINFSNTVKFNIDSISQSSYIKEYRPEYLQLFENKEVNIKNVLFYRKGDKPGLWNIITNMKNNKLEDIASLYCEHWPYLDEALGRHMKVIEESRLIKDKSFLGEKWELLQKSDSSNFYPVFLDFLKQYLYYRFFPKRLPFSEVNWELILNMEGRLSKKTTRYLRIYLTGAVKSQTRQALKDALLFINEAGISWFGRKMLFFLR